MKAENAARDPLIFGWNQEEGLVAVEHVEKAGEADKVRLFFRKEKKTEQKTEDFRPFIMADVKQIGECPVPYDPLALKGNRPLNLCAQFRSWKDFLKAKDWLGKHTGRHASDPHAPYFCISDPVQQYLTASGRTSLLGMRFEDLRRMQVDIECRTSAGFEFCNAEREGDGILAVAMADESGWCEVISAGKMDEKELLDRFVATVRERDPDVIEGHNIFNFDLPYLAERARRHGVKLALGRDGSVPKRRSSRFSVGERTIAYERFEVFGRHVVDTLFLVHAYDITHRSLGGYGLKEVARHFGVAAPERVYLDGAKIGEMFDRDPEKVRRYVEGDVTETRSVSNILSNSYFVQAQMLPYTYQNICVRGNATKIDALMVREYLRARHSLPRPDEAKDFEGGYTDMFVQGVVQNVHHCDVRSLYPSLMLTRSLAPRTDELGVFLRLLERLKAFRLDAKEKTKRSRSEPERVYLDALQAAFKVLINSFYGYLGFSQARFSDFDAAEKVTADGRELLKSMIGWLREHGAVPIEIDTDGIYFVPPPVAGGRGKEARNGGGAGEMESFRTAFADSLPEGIEVEFDGEFRSMYSYKMKNYALLTADGEVIIKGAALKSRGLEPFQRSFLEELVRLKLEGRDAEVLSLKARYESAIHDREWPVEMLAKTETLQDAPSTYEAKKARGKRARSAVYELALASGRAYRAGDQVTYYVTGEKKNVAVHENARLISEWDPDKRDENVAYYLAKLEALYRKFGEGNGQTEMDFGGSDKEEA